MIKISVYYLISIWPKYSKYIHYIDKLSVNFILFKLLLTIMPRLDIKQLTIILSYFSYWQFCNVEISQFSRSVMSDSLQPHESQHTRPLCPSPTPRVHPDSGPSSQWCHPAISSSVIPFSSCPQSLPASESFPMSQLFTWGSQSTGVSG